MHDAPAGCGRVSERSSPRSHGGGGRMDTRTRPRLRSAERGGHADDAVASDATHGGTHAYASREHSVVSHAWGGGCGTHARAKRWSNRRHSCRGRPGAAGAASRSPGRASRATRAWTHTCQIREASGASARRASREVRPTEGGRRRVAWHPHHTMRVVRVGGREAKWEGVRLARIVRGSRGKSCAGGRGRSREVAGGRGRSREISGAHISASICLRRAGYSSETMFCNCVSEVSGSDSRSRSGMRARASVIRLTCRTAHGARESCT
jgi:hypothetical protein